MKQWLKHILYIPKHQKPTDENILRLLMPSVVGIIICMVCLAGSSWAWFSASVQTRPQNIQAAEYELSVAVNGKSMHGSIELEEGKSYTITLTASGTAEKFGGYCKLEGAGKTFYTEQVLPGHTLTFTFSPDEAGTYTFTPVWGEYTGDGDIIGQQQTDTDGDTSSPPANAQNSAEYAEYVVQSGDNLWEIAQAHGTTVDELAVYNGISDPTSLQIGQTIKIPSEEYEIPSSPTVSDSKDEPAQQPTETENPAADSSVVSYSAEPSDEIGNAGPADEQSASAETSAPDSSDLDQTNESQLAETSDE